MNFKLFYKDYDYKITWSAKREFKRETGRGLWSTLQGIIRVYNENLDGSINNLMEALGKHIDEVDGAILLWVLAKQCNSALQLSEIADACDQVGWRPTEKGEYAQPYTFILYSIVLEVDKMYQQEAIQAKKRFAPSEGEQDSKPTKK